MTLPEHVGEAFEAIMGGTPAADLESDILEFKTQVPRSVDDAMRDLAEACACLANSAGGVVVVGVKDRAVGREAFTGCTLEAGAARARIFELCDPPLMVSADVVTFEGAGLLVLSVPSSVTVHAVAGRVRERVGSACVPMSTDRIATVVADRRGDDWTAADSGVPIEAASPQALEGARRLLRRLPNARRRSLADGTDVDLLRALGVVTPAGALSNAGALLLCDRLDRGEEIAYVFRQSPSGALRVNEHLDAPLLTSLERVLDLIDARVERTSVSLGGGQQVQIADLPDAAVREAVVNAVMHRDYRRHEGIVIEHSPTRLSVTSPGPFVTGVTAANVLTTSSRTRNPSLGGAIRMLGLAETAGMGVDRMYAAMAAVGHQPPTFEASTSQVRVTLLGGAPNSYLARYAASLPGDEAEDADTMMVLLTLLARRTTNATAMAPVLQRPIAEAQGVLQRLASAELAIVEPTRETVRSVLPNYRLRGEVIAALGPAVSYNRRSPDEYDRKIIGLVRESGQVNGRMVRLLLDLDTVAASRVLADLVERGVLVKTSEAQRGPSVTYGPGPQFPPPPRPRRRSRASTDEEHA